MANSVEVAGGRLRPGVSQVSCYLVSDVDGSAFDIDCGFWPSVVRVFNSPGGGSPDEVFEWVAAMEDDVHVKDGSLVAATLIDSRGVGSDRNGFRVEGVLTGGGTAYLEVHR